MQPGPVRELVHSPHLKSLIAALLEAGVELEADHLYPRPGYDNLEYLSEGDCE